MAGAAARRDEDIPGLSVRDLSLPIYLFDDAAGTGKVYFLLRV